MHNIQLLFQLHNLVITLFFFQAVITCFATLIICTAIREAKESITNSNRENKQCESTFTLKK